MHVKLPHGTCTFTPRRRRAWDELLRLLNHAFELLLRLDRGVLGEHQKTRRLMGYIFS
jgi:hypothetical protein